MTTTAREHTDGDRSVRTSTMPTDVPDEARERTLRNVRRVGLGIFTGFVLLGLLGLLGVRSTTVDGATGSLRVSLRHAAVARPALAVPYELQIRRDDGFAEPIEVRVTTGYLAALDENGAHPQPDQETTTAGETVWTFDPPEGPVFTVWLDTRVEPGAQWRRDGTTTVTSEGDVVVLRHPMWILP